MDIYNQNGNNLKDDKKMDNESNMKFYYPLFIGIVAAVCFGLGWMSQKRVSDAELQIISGTSDATVRKGEGSEQKLFEVLNLIKYRYVDTVDINSLTEKLLPKLAEVLDPHTTYIPAENLQIVNDDLSSSFFGIGVQFNLQEDTVHIVSVISGGPSEKAGILQGDKIVMVSDTSFVGPKMNTEGVVKSLRGPKDTHVKIGIKREGVEDLIYFDIVRGEIPMYTIDCCYMLNHTTGYVKVDRFGEFTYEEFVDALNVLLADGAKQFVVDLRGNGGGYISAVVNMAKLFLKKGDMVVYTCARGESDSQDGLQYKNESDGQLCNVPLVVMIDKYSASASEIFAGTMQDNDRAVVVGRRSFGKGLVQQQFPLSDGSAIRLTIARYYTPSGRCIQKYYNDEYDYRHEIEDREINGELGTKDSVSLSNMDTTSFKSLRLNRMVVGGVGVMPDFYVPIDTTKNTRYFVKSVNTGMLYKYALKVVEQKKFNVQSYKDNPEGLVKMLKSIDIVSQFVNYAKDHNIEPNKAEIEKSKSDIFRMISSYIVRNVCGREERYGDRPFYSIFNEGDDMLNKAVESFDSDLMKNIMSLQ